MAIFVQFDGSAYRLKISSYKDEMLQLQEGELNIYSRKVKWFIKERTLSDRLKFVE